MDDKERLMLKNSFGGDLVYGTRKFNRSSGSNHHIDTVVKLATDFFIDSRAGYC